MHQAVCSILRVAFGLLLVALASPVAAQAPNFGLATAVSGDNVFVGQPANFYGPGVVYLYETSDGGWVEAGRLFSPDSAVGDGFGRSLATDGEYLVVGAPGSNGEASVHLFMQSAGDTWLPHSAFTTVRSDGGGLGAAVAIGDGRAYVGAPGLEEVYVMDIVDRSFGRQTVLSPDDLERSSFGQSLHYEDGALIVGAPTADRGRGAAVIYHRDETGEWSEQQVLRIDDEAAGDGARFGSAVTLEDGLAYVGAPRALGATGSVFVYELVDGEWSLVRRVAADAPEAGSRFGSAVAVTSDELWVGAPNAGGDLSGRGDGAVVRFSIGGDWSETGRIIPDSANTAAWPFGFGFSITVGDDVAVVGMPTRDFGEGRTAILAPAASGEWAEVATVMGEIATAVAQIETGANCDEGSVEVFQCNNIEVVSFTPVSQLGGPRGVWVNDVWGWTDAETGRDYALVSRRDGAAFVDLTNPADPQFIGSLPRTQGSRPSVWRDIKVYKDHAYIVSDGAGAHGMQVFDLTRLRGVEEPQTFEPDAHYDNVFSAHNVVADTVSGFLYIVGSNSGGETCGGGLHIVDAREPKSPKFAGCYNDPTGARARGYTHDAQCVTYSGPDERYTGREICVGSNEVEINIADVTDKENPVPIGRSGYPNAAYAHQGWFDETQRYFYMGDEADEAVGSVEGTRTLIWDLAELDDPQLVSEYIAPVRATDHNLFIKGDRVFMSNYGSGLRVLDISDRENPYEMAFFDSAPKGDNEAGTSASQSGAWSNYPFFESGLVVFTSVREGLFVVRVKPRTLIP